MQPFLNLGFISIPTFYLVLSLSLVISLYFLSLRVEAHKSYDRKTAFDLSIVLMFAGFIGGRLFHVIYEAPTYYLHYPLQIFQFWNGGYVYFGGMLAALAAGYAFLKYKKESFLHWADFMTPSISLMYALGRIGCFFEGCCYGRYCDLPWAINNRHPTQIYMTLAELLTFLVIIKIKPSAKAGRIFYSWLALHSLSRFIIEFYRDDDRGSLLVNFFSISQIISLIIFIFALKKLQKVFI